METNNSETSLWQSFEDEVSVLRDRVSTVLSLVNAYVLSRNHKVMTAEEERHAVEEVVNNIKHHGENWNDWAVAQNIADSILYTRQREAEKNEEDVW